MTREQQLAMIRASKLAEQSVESARWGQEDLAEKYGLEAGIELAKAGLSPSAINGVAGLRDPVAATSWWAICEGWQRYLDEVDPDPELALL